MKTDGQTPDDIQRLKRELIDFARTRTTAPPTAYAAMLAAGVQLAIADLSEQRAFAMMVHLFGEMIDLGRLMLEAGMVEPFDPDAPAPERRPDASEAG